MKHFVWRLDFSKVWACGRSGGNWNRRQLSFDLNFRTQTIVLEGWWLIWCNRLQVHTRSVSRHIQRNLAFWEVCKVTVLGWFVRARREIASLPLSIHTHNGVDSVNIRSVEQWNRRTASPMCGQVSSQKTSDLTGEIIFTLIPSVPKPTIWTWQTENWVRWI